jgi:hypothetical protein
MGLFGKEIKKPIQHTNEIITLWGDVVIKMEKYISGTN